MTSATPIRVLIVDDHEMLAESLVRLLADDPGIHVLGHEGTAAAGIQKAAADRPDVVIMDFQLPDMDGATATRELLLRCPRAKVITLTGSGSRGAYFATKQAGASAWVRKTHALGELALAVHNVHAGRLVDDNELDDLPTLEQLRVHYQPIVRLATRGIVGFEALVRWEHPERGLLAPDQFLHKAEQVGLLSTIDRFVRKTASQQLADWQADRAAQADSENSTRPRLWMSVNLSAGDLARAAIGDEVLADIEPSGIDPGDFVLEVTETVLIEDEAGALAQLDRFKAFGLHLALDDFGSGFSALSYLRRFPFDHLKVDASFTAELPGSPRAMSLVRSIHDLASGIGLRSIAEGIEREDQAQALLAMGWEHGQGYLYSRPLPAEHCRPLLESGEGADDQLF